MSQPKTRFVAFAFVCLLTCLPGLAAALKLGETVRLPTVTDATGQTVKLSGLKGKWLVLFFYPKAGTSSCTAQNIAYSDAIDKFRQANAVVFGVSKDSAREQQKFMTDFRLKVPQLPDQKETLGRVLGVAAYERFYDRDTVVISPQGRVVLLKRQSEAVATPGEVLKFIRLQK
jgi:thioredoxin-dependent peroxiredoxin